jgi:hypothetical protein
MAAIEGKELRPQDCPVHAPNAVRDAREAKDRAATLADLDEAGHQLAADAPPRPAPRHLAAVMADAFRDSAPALNSAELENDVRRRFGIPTDAA